MLSLPGQGAAADRTRLLLSCDPAADRREVPDPYYGGVEDFGLVFRLVDSACAALLETLAADGPS